MTTQITFIDEFEYLLVQASGDKWETRDGVEAILSISERAKEQGYKLILIDRRDLSNPSTEIGRFEAGRTIAEVFPPPFRLAVVYSPEKMERFGENVAVNRGAVSKIF